MQQALRAAGAAPAGAAARLGDDLGIDSLTMVEVVVAAEDRFGLMIGALVRVTVARPAFRTEMTEHPWFLRLGKAGETAG